MQNPFSSCCDFPGGPDHATALSMGDAGLWPALNDALLMFPLTKGLRLALLNLLCSQQVDVLLIDRFGCILMDLLQCVSA